MVGIGVGSSFFSSSASSFCSSCSSSTGPLDPVKTVVEIPKVSSWCSDGERDALLTSGGSRNANVSSWFSELSSDRLRLRPGMPIKVLSSATSKVWSARRRDEGTAGVAGHLHRHRIPTHQSRRDPACHPNRPSCLCASPRRF